MLDRLSLPTTPCSAPPAYDVARANDAPTSPSAFTAVVDALTEPGPAARANRHEEDAAPDAGRPDGEDEDAPLFVAVCPDAPPVATDLPVAQTANDATQAADAASLAIELATARIRAVIARAIAGNPLTDATADQAGPAAEMGETAGFSRAALAAAAAAAGLIDDASAEDLATNGSGSGDAQQDPAADGRGKARAAAEAAASAIANARQAVFARPTGETEPAAKKAIETTFAAALTNHSGTVDATAMKTLAMGAPWGAVSTASGAATQLLHSVTSALPMAAAEAPTTDTGLQIVQAMRLQWANGVGEAQIALEPNHFGEVSVSLRVEQGQVYARVQAELPVVREWLQTNQSWLRQSLADQGLTLGRIEVTEPAGESNHDERREPHRDSRGQRQPRQPRQAMPGETFEVIA